MDQFLPGPGKSVDYPLQNLIRTGAKDHSFGFQFVTGSQGISWWSMAALSFAAILPLIVIGIVLERYIIKGMAAGAVK